MSTNHEPIVQDGEPNLGRHATLWHVEFGALERVTNEPVPVGSVRFRADEIPTPRILVEYTADELEERWEETLFESPLHAHEVQEEENDE